jgi:hypothetical protein
MAAKPSVAWSDTAAQVPVPFSWKVPELRCRRGVFLCLSQPNAAERLRLGKRVTLFGPSRTGIMLRRGSHVTSRRYATALQASDKQAERV